VLSSFSREEAKEDGVLDEMLTRAADAVEAMITEDITFAMNSFNAQ
jgi:peptidyl-tRNA hydrolase